MFLGFCKLTEKKLIRLPDEAIKKLELQEGDSLILIEKGNDVVVRKVLGEEVASLMMKKWDRVWGVKVSLFSRISSLSHKYDLVQ